MTGGELTGDYPKEHRNLHVPDAARVLDRQPERPLPTSVGITWWKAGRAVESQDGKSVSVSTGQEGAGQKKVLFYRNPDDTRRSLPRFQ